MLGIDVSKASLVCTLLDPQSQQPLWNVEVPNSVRGIEQLLTRTPASAPWVVEPTRQYSRGVVGLAQAAGRAVPPLANVPNRYLGDARHPSTRR